jgi:hypothetical protein
MAGMANIHDPNDHDIRPARSRPVWRKAINLPFDIIDRVFQSDRASVRGVAVMIGGLALMFYLGGNLPKDYLLVEIFAVLAAVTLVASWFH